MLAAALCAARQQAGLRLSHAAVAVAWPGMVEGRSGGVRRSNQPACTGWAASSSAAALAPPPRGPRPPPWDPAGSLRGLHTQPNGKQEEPRKAIDGGGGGDHHTHRPHPALDPLPPWLASTLPPAAWPYAALARLDKPAGTALLLWPGLWSIAAAAPPGCWPDARLTALFAVGALLLRGAGCTVNDLWDRDLDARVSRTAGRPLACGAVSVRGAVAFLGAQLGAGAAVLWQFDPGTVALGCASLPLVAGYPLAKRFLAWPQAVLGLTFNWGALLGWVAAVGAGVADPALLLAGAAMPTPTATAALWAALAASPTPLLFYGGGAAWTQWYDTVYAFQDKADDEAAGVRSSARALAAAAPGREKAGLGLFAAAAGGLLAAGGAAAGLGAPFYGGLAVVGGYGALQLARLDLASPAACGAAFRAHAWLGGGVWVAVIAGRVMS